MTIIMMIIIIIIIIIQKPSDLDDKIGGEFLIASFRKRRSTCKQNQNEIFHPSN